MRSRYTAHAIGDGAYLHRTYASTARQPFAGRDGQKPRVKWTRLVIHGDSAGPSADIGYVEFSAFFRDATGEHEMREKSEFRRVEGQWLYTKAV